MGHVIVDIDGRFDFVVGIVAAVVLEILGRLGKWCA
jgi:hypothetical protein